MLELSDWFLFWLLDSFVHNGLLLHSGGMWCSIRTQSGSVLREKLLTCSVIRGLWHALSLPAFCFACGCACPYSQETLSQKYLLGRGEQQQGWCMNSSKQRFHVPLILRGKQTRWIKFGFPAYPSANREGIFWCLTGSQTICGQDSFEFYTRGNSFSVPFGFPQSSAENSGDADINWPDSALERHSGSDGSLNLTYRACAAYWWDSWLDTPTSENWGQ